MSKHTYLLFDHDETQEVVLTGQPSLWIIRGRNSDAPYDFTLTVHEQDARGVVLGACRVDGITFDKVYYFLGDPEGIDPTEWPVVEPVRGFLDSSQQHCFQNEGNNYKWVYPRNLLFGSVPTKLSLVNATSDNSPLAICASRRKMAGAESEPRTQPKSIYL